MTRPLKGRKLLVASIGVGTLTFACCAAFPGCNLMAPVSCSQDPTQYECRDLSRTEPEDLSQPIDLKKVDQ